jgi:hypothetical protein
MAPLLVGYSEESHCEIAHDMSPEERSTIVRWYSKAYGLDEYLIEEVENGVKVSTLSTLREATQFGCGCWRLPWPQPT